MMWVSGVSMRDCPGSEVQRWPPLAGKGFFPPVPRMFRRRQGGLCPEPEDYLGAGSLWCIALLAALCSLLTCSDLPLEDPGKAM